MNKITREPSGQIIYQGKRIDMYKFIFYLRVINQGKQEQDKVIPSKATEKEVKDFLKTTK